MGLQMYFLSTMHYLLLIMSTMLFGAMCGPGYAQAKEDQPIAADTISYNVTIKKDDPSPHLLVEMAFPSANIKEFTLRALLHTGCKERAYEILSVQNVDLIEDNAYVLRGTPSGNEPISISYKITPRLTNFNFPIEEIEGCRVIVLGEDAIYFDNRALLLEPLLTREQVEPGLAQRRFTNTSLSFHNIPQDWALASSLANSSENKLDLVGGGGTITNAQMLISKQLKTASFQSGKMRVSLVTPSSLINEKSPHTLEHAQDVSEKALRYFNVHLGEIDADTYTVFVIPISGRNDRPGAYTGTSNFESFVTYFTPSAKTLMFDLAITHELAHRWTPRNIGRMREADLPWVREGFTDYVTDRALIELGLDGSEFLVVRINDSLRKKALNPNEPQDPYDEGLAIAFAIDAQNLKSNGKIPGIHAVIRRLVERKAEDLTEGLLFSIVDELGAFSFTDTEPGKSNLELPCTISFGGQHYTQKNRQLARWR